MLNDNETDLKTNSNIIGIDGRPVRMGDGEMIENQTKPAMADFEFNLRDGSTVSRKGHIGVTPYFIILINDEGVTTFAVPLDHLSWFDKVESSNAFSG